MSLQSDAANRHIEGLLQVAYPLFGAYRKEYRFCERMWRFDFAVPSVLCASCERTFHWSPPIRTILSLMDAIEIDGSTFVQNTGHTSGVGLRNWREKNNEAMKRGWKVFHYAPEEVIRAGRKSEDDLTICLRGSMSFILRNPAR